jgi:hypothetical protein
MRVPPNVGLEKLQEVLFIDKINVLPVTWVCSITQSVLEHRCTCTQAHVTALEIPTVQAS